jgi:hypothetical protein
LSAREPDAGAARHTVADQIGVAADAGTKAADGVNGANAAEVAMRIPLAWTSLAAVVVLLAPSAIADQSNDVVRRVERTASFRAIAHFP